MGVDTVKCQLQLGGHAKAGSLAFYRAGQFVG
jgi:hypothetical protein